MAAAPICEKPMTAEARPAISGKGVSAVARAAGEDMPIEAVATTIGAMMNTTWLTPLSAITAMLEVATAPAVVAMRTILRAGQRPARRRDRLAPPMMPTATRLNARPNIFAD